MDLQNLLEHLEDIPYLDQNKAVLAGASYGGYMVSWFMGHEIIKKVSCMSPLPVPNPAIGGC